VRAAGIGHAPTADTLLPDLIDAYFWLKTPGESDGCTETTPDGGHCARYDGMCGSEDSVGSRWGEPRVPEAGEWFGPAFAELVCRARLQDSSDEQVHTNAGADDPCEGMVLSAVRAAAEEQATTVSPPPPPRYNFRPRRAGPPPQPPHEATGSPPSSTLVLTGSQTAQCPLPGPSFESFLLIAACVGFAAWFLFPRYEPRLRRSVGEQRYDVYASGLGRVAHFVFARLEELVAMIRRLRMAGVEVAVATQADELPAVDLEDAHEDTKDGASMTDALRSREHENKVTRQSEPKAMPPPLRFGGRIR